jgi:hypothetical protein
MKYFITTLFLLSIIGLQGQDGAIYKKKYGIDQKKNRPPVFFRHAIGVDVLGIADYGSANSGVGVYYNPAVVFKTTDKTAISVGTNLQTFLNKNGFAFSAPLITWFNYGSSSINYKTYDGWSVFFGAGVNYVTLLGDVDEISFLGPAIDFGFRYYNSPFEMHFTAAKDPRIGGSAFLVGASFGFMIGR